MQNRKLLLGSISSWKNCLIEIAAPFEGCKLEAALEQKGAGCSDFDKCYVGCVREQLALIFRLFSSVGRARLVMQHQVK